LAHNEIEKKKITTGSNQNPHEFVHVLIDEVCSASKIEFTGFSKKTPHVVDYPSTIELINDGIKKYGNRYMGTFDLFVFDKPKPTRLFSRCSYDELVSVFKWRNEKGEDTEDYDTTIIWDNNLSYQSILKRKFLHIGSELQVMYTHTTNPNKQDDQLNVEFKSRMGPPSEFIGPNGKPFGDFKMRLIYDYILILLYLIKYQDHENKSLKSTLSKQIKSYENYTNLPEFKMNELNEIIQEVTQN